MATELKQRRNIIVLFEDCEIDWVWDERELTELENMHREGNTLYEMCAKLERKDPDEVFLGLFYLAKKGHIEDLNLHVLLAGRPNTKRRPYRRVKITEKQYFEYRKQNLDDREIARKIGCSVAGLRSWKRRKGIRAGKANRR